MGFTIVNGHSQKKNDHGKNCGFPGGVAGAAKNFQSEKTGWQLKKGEKRLMPNGARNWGAAIREVLGHLCRRPDCGLGSTREKNFKEEQCFIMLARGVIKFPGGGGWGKRGGGRKEHGRKRLRGMRRGSKPLKH